jgi:hypothetical protein
MHLITSVSMVSYLIFGVVTPAINVFVDHRLRLFGLREARSKDKTTNGFRNTKTEHRTYSLIDRRRRCFVSDPDAIHNPAYTCQ